IAGARCRIRNTFFVVGSGPQGEMIMRMKLNRKSVAGWWLLALLAVASAVAATPDLRLVEAAKKQDKAAVRALIKERADVNAASLDGATPLTWAVHWDDVEMADLLIKAGANVSVANDYGVTPLSLAASNRSVAMVTRLLDAKANPNTALWTG